jgi:hypothetical protein
MRTVYKVFLCTVFVYSVASFVLQEVTASTKFFVRMGLEKGGGSVNLEIFDLVNRITRDVTVPTSATEYRGESTPGINGSSGYGSYLFYDVNFTLPFDLSEGSIVQVCGRGEDFPLRPANDSMPGQSLEPYSCALEMVRDKLVVAFL